MRSIPYLGLATLCCLLTVPPPARAQAPTSKAIFKQVVPEPTGRNGYEELVQACDRLQSSRRAQEWEGKSLTLSQKRLLLADKPVQEALQLVRRGLSKPILSPRTALSTATPMPELSGFRRLGRLLSVQQYVQLADGKEAEALSTLRLGLHFGRAVQTDTLISGLVGIAISSALIQNTAKHLEQFSARDTDQLYRICLEHLNQPSLLPKVLRAEQRFSRVALREMLQQAKGAPDAQDQLPEEEKALAQEFAEHLTPQRIEKFIADVEQQLDQHFAFALQEAAKEPWKRNWSQLPPVDDANPAAQIARMILPSVAAVDRSYNRMQAELQLLAVHAAIRHYRWEHDRLPADVKSLNLGALTTDPFSGSPLEYRTDGERYQLFSVGHPTSPDDPKSLDGRRPVTLTPLRF